MSEKGLLRFTAAERIFHWLYFVAFAVLAVTGAFIYIPWLSFSAGEAGEMSRFLHRLFGATLLVTPLLPLFFSPRAFLTDLGEAWRWRREDVRALRILLTRYYWTGDKRDLPPQGKFTAGQKLNVVLQILTFSVLAVTGVLAWIGPTILPAGVLRVSLILHGLAAAAATSLVLVHIYMVTLLPMTREAIPAMFLGRVSEAHAREYHPRWYEEMERRRMEPRGRG